jgi:hypothetical protein
MLYVKFESIYREIDKHGNQRSFENRFESSGTGSEVCNLLNTILPRIQLPGTIPIQLPREIDKYLLSK